MGASQSGGNPFFVANNDKQAKLSKLLSEFTFISNYQNDFFGPCSILENNETSEKIICRDMLCLSEAELKSYGQKFARRKTVLTSPNVVRCRYQVPKTSVGIFSDELKLVLFFDYILASLQDEYSNRMTTQKFFTHEQISVITCGTIRGYASIENQKIVNSKIRLNNIFFGLEGGVPIPKVTDSELIPSPSNLQEVRNRDQLDNIFLAPQELKQIVQSEDQKEGKGIKAGVFTLGVCLMQLCLLTPSRDLYNYSKRSINYAELQTRLNIIKNKYPLSIYCIIRDMLERNEDSRPSFTKLAESLPTNLKNLPATLNISLMKNPVKSTTNGQSKLLSGSSVSRVLNPLANTRNSKRMQATIASQYRPDIQNSQVYTNGNRYEGQKKDNLRHGRGKYIYNDGSYYMGDWIKGKMEGNGQLYDAQGNLVYDGQWRDDHYQGSGRLMGSSSVDWTKYEGQFRCGRIEGFGEMWFRDGQRYKGQFRNDVPYGKGRMFRKNGNIEQGIWQNGNFISS